MIADPSTPEGCALLRRIATDGWDIRGSQALALFAVLDDAECEIERLRGDLVIERRQSTVERRRAEKAEAAIERVRAALDPAVLDWWVEELIHKALDGES